MNTAQAPETSDPHVRDLTVQVIAAEMYLTHFASKYGRESEEYRNSLKDFGTAWYLLKKNRNSSEFLKEVLAS